MADDRDPAPRVGRDRLGDSRDILEFALDRVGLGVAGVAAPAPIDGVDGVSLGQARADDPERRVVRGGTVDEDKRRSGRALRVRPAAEHRDRGPVDRPDDARRRVQAGCHRYSTSGWRSMFPEPSPNATAMKPLRS